MSFSYRIQSHFAIFFIILGIMFAGSPLPFIAFFAYVQFTFARMGADSGINLWFILPLLIPVLFGISLLIFGISLGRRSLIKGDREGVLIGRPFKKEYFAWSDLESVIYLRTKEPLKGLGRRGLHYQTYYEYLTFVPYHKPPVQVEITYIKGSSQELLNQMASFGVRILWEDK